MRTKRFLAVLAVALAVLVPPGAARWLPPPGAGVAEKAAMVKQIGLTKENCARIRPGMRADEVKAILGMPPGKYTDGRLEDPYEPLPYEDNSVMWSDTSRGRGTRVVIVRFDEDGRAQEAKFLFMPPR